MNNDNFVWTDELVAEYSLASQKLTIFEFKRSKTIPKKEYEILSYIDPDIISDVQNLNVIDNKHSVKWFIAERCNYKIHSIKRLSDGEVFAIGDNVSFIFSERQYEFTINEMTTGGLTIAVIGKSKDGNPFNWDLMSLKKVEDKVPIITENKGCNICGGSLVQIRSRYPQQEPRKVCPTCTTERLEQIQEISNPNYGKASKNNSQ